MEEKAAPAIEKLLNKSLERFKARGKEDPKLSLRPALTESSP